MNDIETLKRCSEYGHRTFASRFQTWIHSKHGKGSAESQHEIERVAAWGQAVIERDTDYIAALEARIAELEAAQVTPEPYPAELIADLHRLDDMRLSDASVDRASSALDGTLPENLDYLNALLTRGFAIPNPAGGVRIIITTAGRAELARITSQGEA